MEKRSTVFITRSIIIIALFVSIVAIYIIATLTNSRKTIEQQHASFSDNVAIGGDFELTDVNGNIFNSDSLKGKLSLVYFGFTFCPDICPESLNKLSEVLITLNKYSIPFNALFITIDPNRDTASVLKEYLGNFHPQIIGLTGTEEQVKSVADKFKVVYNRAASGDDSNYMIDHTAFIYLMDKNNKYLKHFYMRDSPEEIIEYIRLHK